MNKLLERNELLKLILEEIENLKKIELVIKNFPQRKTQAHMTYLKNVRWV